MTRNRTVIAIGLVVAFLLAGFVSGYASSAPDGLEKVAAEEGFLDTAQDHGLADSPVADYALRGVEDERLAGGLAGVIGVALTFAVGGVVFVAVTRTRRSGGSSGSSGSSGSQGSSGSGRREPSRAR